MSNIRPLYDRVVIRPLEEERTTAGGIVLPDSATEKPMRGKVLATGPGKAMDDGKLRELAVKIGDVVLYGKYAGTEIKVADDSVVIMREDDIMGVVEANS